MAADSLASSTRCTVSLSTQRETCTRPNHSKGNACRNSSTRVKDRLARAACPGRSAEEEKTMKINRNFALPGAFIATVIALSAGQRALQKAADQQEAVQAPTFEVDPFWPKPLPNHWVLGNVIGVGVDAKDHVFIVHLVDKFDRQNEIGAAANPPLSECCVPAPPVIEFDPNGDVVNAWGGPGEGYEWPASNHGISIDNKDNVWIGGNG